ncbi:unnamed protein product [Caenorhabditis angaria]|uniref:Uncharacterized protein n=1 Tax=Caenorhabditis angaria TaxID=860376 RepID=A0A9P1NCI3_9PELO|nr:unnamed protein product [Caenorhabditis angaria]
MVDRIGWAAINHINQYKTALLESEKTRRGKRMIMEYERTFSDLDEEKKQQEKLKKSNKFSASIYPVFATKKMPPKKTAAPPSKEPKNPRNRTRIDPKTSNQ